VCEKVELVEDGVGAQESNYLASLAKSLETYSQHVTAFDSNSTNIADVTGRIDYDDDRRRQILRLQAGNIAEVVRGVSALASARSAFTKTPCSYSEVRVRFAIYLYCLALNIQNSSLVVLRQHGKSHSELCSKLFSRMMSIALRKSV